MFLHVATLAQMTLPGSNDASFSNKRGWSLEGYGCEFKTHWVHVKKKMSYCWDLQSFISLLMQLCSNSIHPRIAVSVEDLNHKCRNLIAFVFFLNMPLKFI